MTFLFKHISWVSLAFNALSLMLYFMFGDRIGYKIQTFSMVYLFIILCFIDLTTIRALLTFLSVRVSMILGYLLFVPSGINLYYALTWSFE